MQLLKVTEGLRERLGQVQDEIIRDDLDDSDHGVGNLGDARYGAAKVAESETLSDVLCLLEQLDETNLANRLVASQGKHCAAEVSVKKGESWAEYQKRLAGLKGK